MRCKLCHKKLNKLYVEMYTCKCKLIFCSEHMFEHKSKKCNYDYRKERQDRLRKQLPVVKPKKFTRVA